MTTHNDKPEKHRGACRTQRGVGDSEKNSEAESRPELLLAPEMRALRGLYATDGESCDDYADISALTNSFLEQTDAIRKGNLDRPERMLYSQAVTLEGIFSRLLERSLQQEYLPNVEALMKLALKAQNQSRATLETLRSIKAEPAIFARQANISHGPQQVNNMEATDRVPVKFGGKKPQNELLEETDEQRLDGGTAGSSGAVDSHLGSLEGVNRTKDR